jgi:hypothetical protein
VLMKNEGKTLEELTTSNGDSLNFICLHFGNGDEQDMVRVQEYFPQAEVFVYPGTSYSFLSFKDETSKEETLRKCTSVDPAFYLEINEKPIFILRTALTAKELQAYSKKLDFPESVSRVPIPGVEVIDSFLSKDMEDQIHEYLKTTD